MSGLELGWITLGAGVLVVIVVTALLAMLIATVGRIRSVLDQVWLTGQEIANNAINLDLLRRMNLVAADSLKSVRSLSETDRNGGRA